MKPLWNKAQNRSHKNKGVEGTKPTTPGKTGVAWGGQGDSTPGPPFT